MSLLSQKRLPTIIIILGWLSPVLYLWVLLLEGREFSDIIIEFLSPQYYGYMFRALVLLAPFASTIIGYFLIERERLLLEKQKVLEKALSEWRGTFDSLPYGVMILDKEYNILRANLYISRHYGAKSPKEIIGKKCFEIVHNTDTPLEDCPLKDSIKTTEPSSLEHFDKHRGKWFLFSIYPIVIEDGLGFIHSILDITERKEKEQKLEEGRLAFLNMLKELDIANKELRALFNGLIFAFASALDAKSPWTKGHSERVTAYALSIAKEMGLDESELETLKTAAILHDIGKIGTYDVILDKPGRLTDREFALIKEHPVKGAEILKHVKQLEPVIPIIRHHHERLDGRGYPDGLKGDDIPLLSRIICVADSFDSMTANRPYRPAPGKKYAIDELKRCSGTQFDPKVVEAFLRLLEIENLTQKE